jgi:ABC-2 type transport system permease protein
VRPVLRVAENELSMLLRNPIVLVFGALMLVFVIVYGMGASVNLPEMKFGDHDFIFFYAGIGNFYWMLSMFFAFFSMCVGITSVADERSGHTFRVLFTKPLYRRDVIAGKLLGIGTFLLIALTLVVVLLTLLVTLIYGGPASPGELVLRVGAFTFTLYLSCAFTMGLIMLLGVVFNRAEALVISLAYISFEWLTQTGLTQWLGGLEIINPMVLYIYASVRPGNDLLMTTVPFDQWLANALPYIALLLAEVVIVALANCMLFAREDT